MSTIPSIDEVRAVLIELQEFKGKEVADTVLHKYAPDLQRLTDEDRQRVIDDAEGLLPAERPRSAPGISVGERVLKSIQDLTLTADDTNGIQEAKQGIYNQMLGAWDSIDKKQRRVLMKALRGKLPDAPGKPTVDALVDELELRRQPTAVKARPRNALFPESTDVVLFRHHMSSKFLAGLYDRATREFLPDFPLAEIDKEGRTTLYGQVGKQAPETNRIPHGTFEFRPGNETQVETRPSGFVAVNLWTVPPLRKKAVTSAIVPLGIRTLLLHVLGGDERVLKRFLNWLAVAYQINDRTNTAWVITGINGTGKGLLINLIIRPLFGHQYCRERSWRKLDSRFNEYADCAVMLNIDEDKAKGPWAESVEGAVRTLITQDNVTVEKKHKSEVDTRNYLNVLVTSNQRQPIQYQPTDRRWNQAPHQEKPLEGGDKRVIEALVKQIESELPAMAGYLRDREIDVAEAMEPMQTEERAAAIENSATTPERISAAYRNSDKEGDLDYFLRAFFTKAEDPSWRSDADERREVLDVRDILLEWAAATNLPGVKTLKQVCDPAWHIRRVYNLLMPPKYEKSPQEVGKALNLRVDASAGPNRSDAYRVYWRTKKSAEELAEAVEGLKRLDNEWERRGRAGPDSADHDWMDGERAA